MYGYDEITDKIYYTDSTYSFFSALIDQNKNLEVRTGQFRKNIKNLAFSYKKTVKNILYFLKFSIIKF